MKLDEPDDVVAGVTDAWLIWLADHPVSVPEIIEAAVKSAVGDWLDEHGAAIMLAALRPGPMAQQRCEETRRLAALVERAAESRDQ